jgi:8-oxo-dGTP pyrophosphatase MutT (NUDIX family)
MEGHYKTLSAIIVALVKNVNDKTYVLLQKRQNTGFADGLWDLSFSGHVEKDESMTDAAVREAKEELCVDIDKHDLNFFTLIHKRDKDSDLVYYNGYFYCRNFVGTPQIGEPTKCSAIQWFDIDNLPKDLIDDRKEALKAFTNGTHYIEYGWK